MNQLFAPQIEFLDFKYPGKFNELKDVEFKESDLESVMGYNVKDNVVFYNKDIFERKDSDILSIVAFIGRILAVAEYSRCPASFDQKPYNMVVQLKVIHEINTMGEFELPDDTYIPVHVDHNLPVLELYKIFAAELKAEQDEIDQSHLTMDTQNDE